MYWMRLLLPALLLATLAPATAATSDAPNYAAFDSFLGAVTAANLQPWRAYHDVFNYTHHLPVPFALNGIAYPGGARLRHVVQRALAGQRISVGLIGGSISCGHGVERGREDWFSWVEVFLRRAFPAATIHARNGCVPAVMSEYVNMCLDKFVDQDVDLMLVEFAVNDGYVDGSVNNTRTASFERLMRKLLGRAHSPALVLVQFLPTAAKAQGKPFYASVEDHYGVLAQYYGAAWLSVRDALWHAHINDWNAFRADQLLLADARHPTPLGHKYMADLVAALIQRAFLDLLMHPHQPQGSGADSAALPEPMFPGNYESENLACTTGLDFRAVVLEHEDWYFVNEGTDIKPKWGFVSHVPNATLVFQLDTRALGAQPLPELTPQQRDSLERQGWLHGQAGDAEAAPAHGGVGAAAADAAGVATAGPGGTVAAPVASADGSEPLWMVASREAEHLAAEAARTAPMPPAGALPPLHLGPAEVPASAAARAQAGLDAGHMLVGAHGSGIVLPADAHLPVPDSHFVGMEGAATGADGTISSGARRRRLAQREAAPAAAAGPQLAVAPARLQQLQPQEASAPKLDMVIWIGYLKSYRYMGAARMWCISGCVCEPVLVSGFQEWDTSQTVMARLRASQSPECRVGVQILQWSPTGKHHKFKVSGVMLSHWVDYTGEKEFGEVVMYGAAEGT